MRQKTILSVFGIRPYRIGAVEKFARELSTQLTALGWRHALCFYEEPAPAVRRYLEAPNATLELVHRPWIWSAATARDLYRLQSRYRAEIVHFHFTGFVSPYPWLVKLLGARQIYFTDQSSRPEGYIPAPAPWWKRLLVRIVNAPLDGVVCVSGYNQRDFAARGLLAPEKFHLIYNSVDVRAAAGQSKGAEFRQRFGIAPGRLVIAQVSAMTPAKGIPDLLRAVREVVAANRLAHLVLVGDGRHRQEFLQLARELGIEDHVTFAGTVLDPVGEGVYDAAAVVCQVSRWEEAFGYVIAEAMSCGKPVIATRVGGIPELVQDGQTGCLVERGDSAAMAARILHLLEDAALRGRLGECGRMLAAAKFDLDRNVAQLIGLYGIGAARVRRAAAAGGTGTALTGAVL